VPPSSARTLGKSLALQSLAFRRVVEAIDCLDERDTRAHQ
jgi:hypothetical protein